jgi:HK97 family phage prohead protease
MKTPTEMCQLKFDSGKEGLFTGYASVFGGVDAYGDTIQKGAYAETIEKNKASPLMLYQHSSSDIIGKWTKMEEDDHGLIVEGEFTPGHSLASDVRALAKHGAVNGLSIGFTLPSNGSEEKDDGTRLLKQIDLHEVSVVAFPADKAARITNVKEEIETLNEIKDFERFLRESGQLSKSMAMAFIGQFKRFVRSDSESAQDEQMMQKQLVAKANDDLARVIGNLKIDLN